MVGRFAKPLECNERDDVYYLVFYPSNMIFALKNVILTIIYLTFKLKVFSMKCIFCIL